MNDVLFLDAGNTRLKFLFNEQASVFSDVAAFEHFLYFDYGDQTLDQYYPPFHKKLSKFLNKQNANPKTVFVSFFPGDAHDEIAWQKRLPQALKKALNTKLKMSLTTTH